MRNLVGGIVLFTIGTLLLLDNLGIADFGDVVTTFWPLALIAVGISIILRRRPSPLTPAPAGTPPMQAESFSPLEGDLVHQSNVFGDIIFTAGSQTFKGGSVSTVFGDSIVNLSKTRTAEGDHLLRVHGVFGNTTILLPPDAGVAIIASAVFGEMTVLGQRRGGFSSDLRITTPSYASSSNRLTINVNRVFGNIRVE